MFGAFESETVSTLPGLMLFLIVGFLFVGSLLLLNLVVAMMTNTFEAVQSKAQLQRTLQQAQLVFYYQNQMSRDDVNRDEVLFHLHLMDLDVLCPE
jgi:hypothetical protein